MRVPGQRAVCVGVLVGAFAAALLVSCSLVVDTSGLAGGASVDALAPDGAFTGPDGGSGGDGSARCTREAGPTMVDLGAFCIDATEVTAADFVGFKKSGATVASSQPACANAAPGAFNASDAPTFPARNVTWCDADAYCSWAGKHLCGMIGGGTLDSQNGGDPELSEWVAACTNAGTTKYPYGNTLVSDQCNIGGNGNMLQKVGSRTGCRTDAGAFDMIGNVWEWTNVCQGSGTGTQCMISGGSVFDTDPKCVGRDVHPITFSSANVGFRCCADP